MVNKIKNVKEKIRKHKYRHLKIVLEIASSSVACFISSSHMPQSNPLYHLPSTLQA